VSDNGRLFTSESVTEGHPDKICDAISDSVLDSLLKDDPKSRVAVETLVTTGQVHVVGEVTTSAKEAFADITDTVRQRILEIGYDSSEKGFDGASCGVNIGIRRCGQGLRGPCRGGEGSTRPTGRRRSGSDVRIRDPRHP
jgi:S-adenosylmethionine synthetase